MKSRKGRKGGGTKGTWRRVENRWNALVHFAFASGLNYGVFRARLICLHSLSVALNRRLLVEGVQTNQRCGNKTKSQRSGRAPFDSSFEKQIELILSDSLLDEGAGLSQVFLPSNYNPSIFNLTHSRICAKLLILTRIKTGVQKYERERNSPNTTKFMVFFLWIQVTKMSCICPWGSQHHISHGPFMNLFTQPELSVHPHFLCISQEAAMWWPHKSRVLLEHFY